MSHFKTISLFIRKLCTALPFLIIGNESLSQPLSLNVATTNPDCGKPNGIITATASGGSLPYTYFINGYPQNIGYFTGRAADSYTISVTDAVGGSSSTVVILTQSSNPPVLAISSFNNPTGCNAFDGSFTLAASGGTPPYEYSRDFINYQPANTFTNLTAGEYWFYVRDANGCLGGTFPTNLTYTCPMTIWGYHYTGSVLCGQQGFIHITGVSGGTTPYTYSIDGTNFTSNPDFDNLSPDRYNIYVRDVTGLILVRSFHLSSSCNLDVTYIGVEAACLQSDGALTITAVNGVAPYTYTIDGVNYQASNVFTGLASGNYTITAKDAVGATVSRTATVFDRCPLVSLFATNAGCMQTNGAITATAVKGTAPYTYSIDGVNFQSGNVFTSLAPGPYTITLKDALGFTATSIITILENCYAVTAIPTHAICGNPGGRITATAANGTPPYRYSIDGVNFQSSNTFTGLAAGNYTITAKDATNLTVTTTVTINDSPNPVISISTTPATCLNNDGNITITATGGVAPLQYSIDGFNFVSNNVFNNIVSGTYTIRVKDALGCGAGTTISVVLICPNITTTVSPESCGRADGSITITVNGFNTTPPYQYSIDGTNFQANNQFTGLTSGAYTVTVKDAPGYSNTASVTIANNCPVVTAVGTDGTCGNSNGSITATGSSGSIPYQYSIDGVNYQSSSIFTGLSAGAYTITIKDAVGSVNTTPVTINNIPGPLINAATTAATCINNNGTITLSATGGTLPVQYSMDGTSYQSAPLFTAKPSGNYTGFIKDANSCIASVPVIISLNDDLTLEAGNDLRICEGKSVRIDPVSNGSDFTWSSATTLDDPSRLNPLASPVISTKYYITARLGICEHIDSVTVNVDPAPVPIAGNGAAICKGQDAHLDGSGGEIYFWSPSTYLSDPGIRNPDVINPSATITYHLKVEDANGCQSLLTSSVTIQVNTNLKVSAGSDTSIVMDQPFRLSATDINNSGFLTYTWSPSLGLDDPDSQHPIATLGQDMTYKVTAITDGGCEATDEIKIKVYKGPDIYVANAFTPNNDGLNDDIKAIPVGIRKFRHFIIYNRWGQQVFYTTNPSRAWDGRNLGVASGTEIFVWIAEGTDDNGRIIQKKGTITLVR